LRAGRGELLKFRIEEVVPSHERHGRIHASNGCWKPLARKWNGTKLVPELWAEACSLCQSWRDHGHAVERFWM